MTAPSTKSIWDIIVQIGGLGGIGAVVVILLNFTGEFSEKLGNLDGTLTSTNRNVEEIRKDQRILTSKIEGIDESLNNNLNKNLTKVHITMTSIEGHINVVNNDIIHLKNNAKQVASMMTEVEKNLRKEIASLSEKVSIMTRANLKLFPSIGSVKWYAGKPELQAILQKAAVKDEKMKGFPVQFFCNGNPLKCFLNKDGGKIMKQWPPKLKPQKSQE